MSPPHIARSTSPTEEDARRMPDLTDLYRAAVNPTCIRLLPAGSTQDGNAPDMPENFPQQVQLAWKRCGRALVAKQGFPHDVALLAVARCVANSNELTTRRMAVQAQQLWDSQVELPAAADESAAFILQFLQ